MKKIEREREKIFRRLINFEVDRDAKGTGKKKTLKGDMAGGKNTKKKTYKRLNKNR